MLKPDGFITLSLIHTDTIYLYLSIDEKRVQFDSLSFGFFCNFLHPKFHINDFAASKHILEWLFVR